MLEALVRRDLPIDHVCGSIERTTSVVLLYPTDSPNSSHFDANGENGNSRANATIGAKLFFYPVAIPMLQACTALTHGDLT